MPDKIDVARLVDEAMRSANAAIVSMPIDANFDYVWHEHFARLVLEEAAKVCDSLFPLSRSALIAEGVGRCAAAIRSQMP